MLKPVYLCRCRHVLRLGEACNACGAHAPPPGLPHCGCYVLGPFNVESVDAFRLDAEAMQIERALGGGVVEATLAELGDEWSAAVEGWRC